MKTIVTALLLLVAISVHGQNFEGKIVYQNSFRSKMAGVTEEQLTAQMGTRQDYYIKDGSYRSVIFGASIQWAVYVSSENRIYSKVADKETLLWIDAGSNPNDVVSIEINKGVPKFLAISVTRL